MAIVSTPHLAMKFPSLSGDILTVHVDQKEAREYYVESLRVEPLRNDRSPKRKSSRKHDSPRKAQPIPMEPAIALVDLDPRTNEDRLEAREELLRVPLLDEEHSTCVGMTMATVEVEIIHATLKKNVDMFVWTSSDMSGVSSDVITHKLSVFKEARPITQKKRDYDDEKCLAAETEAEKLLSTNLYARLGIQLGFQRCYGYQANGNWRMCVDYKNLNSALISA